MREVGAALAMSDSCSGNYSPRLGHQSRTPSAMGTSLKKRKLFDASPERVLDAAVLLRTAHELEGNRRFQSRDLAGAMDQYEQALKLIPRNHRDRAFVHRNRAACLMEMKPVQYDAVIHECNLALEAYPRFGRVLFRRARAFEATGKLWLALRDVQDLLQREPNHQEAVEMAKRLRVALGNREKVQQGLQGKPAASAAPLFAGTSPAALAASAARGSPLNGRGPCLPNRPAGGTSKKLFLRKDVQSLKVQRPETLPSSSLKLIYDHDIRLAQMSVDCKFSELREVVRKTFPSSKAVLIKYEDIVGDLVTITNTEELRLAEEAARYNTVKATIRKLQASDSVDSNTVMAAIRKLQAADSLDSLVAENVEIASSHKKQGCSTTTFTGCSPLRLHVVEVSPEQEPTVQEGDALMDTNTKPGCGYLLMITALEVDFLISYKQPLTGPRLSYVLVENKYEEALRVNPDFYGVLALGQENFVSAKLWWSLAVANHVDLNTWDSSEMLHRFCIGEPLLHWRRKNADSSEDVGEIRRVKFDEMGRSLTVVI